MGRRGQSRPSLQSHEPGAAADYLGECYLALGQTQLAYDQLFPIVSNISAGDEFDKAQVIRLQVLLAQTRRQQNRYQQALEHLDNAEAAAIEAGTSQQLAEIFYIRGNVYFPLGDYAKSLQAQKKALTNARLAGSVQLQVGALSGFADANYLRGSNRTGADYYKQTGSCFGKRT